MSLLTANQELRKDRIFNFTLPAWYTRLDGELIKTCPNAGACAKVCYARNGTYLFPAVKSKHEDNLRRLIMSPKDFEKDLIRELRSKKFKPNREPRIFPFELTDGFLQEWASLGGAAVRIHDSGDFFADWYLDLWLSIARRFSVILFYAYTKEVSLLKSRDDYPPNFRFIYSYGGLEDSLIDPENDRHADVFPTLEKLIEAGYTDQADNDLYAVLLPTNRIGIVANNIPAFRKRLNGRRFSELRNRK